MFLLPLLACAPSEPDTSETCPPGFDLFHDACVESADGESADDTGAPASAWGYVEQECQTGDRLLTFEADGEFVSAWGAYTPELLDACSYSGYGDCPGAEQGATGTPLEFRGTGPGLAVLQCLELDATGERDGQPYTWTGFYYNPIRAYYLAN
jgi:hypothetical protein